MPSQDLLKQRIRKGEVILVLCQDKIVGYSLLNFTRASAVVNCQ